jgi:uncharacterized integral membrane protein (TIGR00697 family)
VSQAAAAESIDPAARGNLVSLWFVAVAALFVTSLITANIVAVKIVKVWWLQVPAGTITLFPLSYIFGDILTEVYGFARARFVIWLGFLCNALAVFAFWLSGALPGAAFWQNQAAYDAILGFTWRLLLASWVAYLIGEFINSFLLARLKVMTRGRWLWSRTISSTVIGQFVDTFVFVLIAFSGVIPNEEIRRTFLHAWFIKVVYEVVATPLTYLIVGYLKRVDASDVYDDHFGISPFGSATRASTGVDA